MLPPQKKMLNINAPLNLIAVLMLMFFEVSNILEKCIEKKERRKWVKNNYQQKTLNAQSQTLCMSEHQNQNTKNKKNKTKLCEL